MAAFVALLEIRQIEQRMNLTLFGPGGGGGEGRFDPQQIKTVVT